MSLISMILFNEPFRLPKGEVRTHRIDAVAVKYTPPGRKPHPSTVTNLRNIDKIRAALARGIRTYEEISDEVGVTPSGVKKILLDMRASGEVVTRGGGYRQKVYYYYTWEDAA